MGKPHCNYSIRNFRFCSTLGIYPPVPELVEGAYFLSALKSRRGEIGIARGKAERNPG